MLEASSISRWVQEREIKTLNRHVLTEASNRTSNREVRQAVFRAKIFRECKSSTVGLNIGRLGSWHAKIYSTIMSSVPVCFVVRLSPRRVSDAGAAFSAQVCPRASGSKYHVANFSMSRDFCSTIAKSVVHGAMVLALLMQGPGSLVDARAVPPPIMDQNHVVADEVMSLVKSHYIDPAYNGVDWSRLQDELMSKPLRSKNETYTALRNVVGQLDDKYTRILTPQDMKKLRKYDVSGVGLLLTANAKGDLVVASDPLPSSPAGLAGVKQGTIVTAIDGKPLSGTPAFEAAQLMQGDDGSIMKVGVQEPGDSDERVFYLKRSYSEGGGAAVTSSLRESNGRRIGYVRLQDFSARSRGDMENVLRDLDSKGANAYLLDLRQNPGGVFEGALEIAGLLEGRDVIVAKVANRRGTEEAFLSRVVSDKNKSASQPLNLPAKNGQNVEGRGSVSGYQTGAVISPDSPLAILVDENSASASEVLGGSLRDNCRGVVVGPSHSYGKGLIQGVFGLSDGGGVIVTVASYKTPSGMEIQGKGLSPVIRLDDGLVQQTLHFIRGTGIEADIDFSKVEEEIQMCKEAKTANVGQTI